MKPLEPSTLTFPGTAFNYCLRKPEAYRSALHQFGTRMQFKVEDKRIWGFDLDHAITCLRQYTQLNMPDATQDQEAMFRALGFGVSWGTNRKSQHVIIVHNKGG